MNIHLDALSISLAYLLVPKSFVVDILISKFVVLFFLCEVDTLWHEGAIVDSVSNV
jgi:hypothetical protein